MSDFGLPFIPPLYGNALTYTSFKGNNTAFVALTNGVNASTYDTANRAYFYPITVRYTTRIVSLASHNGATPSGNFDIGIYGETGRRIVSTGAVAQVGSGAYQSIAITPVNLVPGNYFLAYVIDNTTSVVVTIAGITEAQARIRHCLQQTAAFPLPETATFEPYTATTIYLVSATSQPSWPY